MNKSFKSIWCEKTGTYIAAAELSRSRGKKSSSAVLAAGLGVIVGLFALSGSAMAANSGLQLCDPGTGNGWAWGTDSNSALNCGTGNDVAFSLNNAGDATGGNGFTTSTARVTGYASGLLELKGTAGISMLDRVQMNNNKITDLDAATLSATSTDAVTGAQLHATNQNVIANTTEVTNLSNAVGGVTRYFKAGGLEDGTDDATASLKSVAIGAGATATTDGTSATNNWNNPLVAGSATQVNSVAIGSGARATGGGTALGDTAVTSAFSGVALGAYTVAGSHGTAVGSGAMAQGTDSSALGFNALATASSALAVGNYSTASGANSAALGSKANATAANSVALGANSIADRSDAVSVGNGTLKRQIINVGAGTLSADSTDVVNGSQLYATNQNVTANAANIAINTTNITSLDSSVTTVNNRVTSIDGRVTNVEGSVTNLTQQLDGGSVGLVKQDATSGHITVAKDTGGMSVDFTGTDGARVLSGVASGKLAVDSQEAVNGSQLFATNQNVQANTTKIASIDGRVNNVENSVTNLTQQLDDGSVGLVKQDATSGHITVAKDTGGMSVDFTGTDGARVLSGVASGKLAVDSQEAVNGSQLFATNQNVQANTVNIATNTAAIANMDGRVNSVQDSVSSLSQQLEATHQTVIEKISTSVQASNSQVATAGDSSQAAVASGDNAVAMGAGATASANNSVALGAGSLTGNRENIVSVGSVGNERAIANVADAVMDTDAVNKRQLDAVSASSQAYTDERINQVQSDIDSVRRDSNGAAAAAMAVATLPQSIIPGRGMASAAVSTMDGESAVAVGISKVAENSRWVTKLAGTVNTRGKLGVSAGIGFHW